MPLTPLKTLLDHAMANHYAVGAFNVNNMEQVQAIMAAAKLTRSPVIIQASRGALKYTDLIYLKHLMMAAAESNPEIPICVHLDHGDNISTVKQAISLGFTSVMIDMSHAPFEENVAASKAVAEYAHAHGVSVEAELGTLGGIEEDISGHVKLTDPEKAEEFVRRTGIDALAVAIGTSHGAYKFKAEPRIAIDLVGEISRRVHIPLVMHGSSSVPAELRDLVNKYGGRMPDACGVPIPAIQAAVRNGICKVNVDTDSRMAMTAAIRKVFAETPEKFDPRDYLGPARDATRDLVASKMRDFGCAGHAGDIPVMTLEQAKAQYYHL